jgi:hypothetical protein
MGWLESIFVGLVFTPFNLKVDEVFIKSEIFRYNKIKIKNKKKTWYGSAPPMPKRIDMEKGPEFLEHWVKPEQLFLYFY